MMTSLLSFDPLLTPPTDGTEMAWGVVRRHVHHPNRRFYAWEPSRGCIGWYRSYLSWKSMPHSLVIAATAATSAGGGSKSAAQLDSSTQIALMWRLSSCIYRLYQLVMRVRVLEIAWWWRKGAVVMSSWWIWNIWSNSVEAEAPRIPDVKLVMFVPWGQTCEHSHVTTSPRCISFGN